MIYGPTISGSVRILSTRPMGIALITVSAGDRHMWEQVQFRNQGPPKRTGHIMSSHAGKILCSLSQTEMGLEERY
jgi:hypothetical protein